MNQFIYDMIHMTEGEKFINYWELWLGLSIFFAVLYAALDRLEKKRGNKNHGNH